MTRPSLHDIFVRIAAPSRWRSTVGKIWIIASTEFAAAVRTKAFLVGSS